MNYIDLHVHSNASDGSLTPREVVYKAAEKGLAAFALTDHDTIQGIEEALSAAAELKETGIFIEVIPGTELSAAYKSQDIHMLGLLIDYKDKTFCRALTEAQEEREKRNEKMVGNLAAAGIDITMAKLREDCSDAIITRAHFANYLTKGGYCKTYKDAFTKYLGSNGSYYVPREYISPQKAIELIKMAGGVAILAHPLLYKLPLEELDTLIGNLKEAGLDGIETFYSSNTGFDEGYVRKFANKYNLLMTGGSDFHGAAKPLIDIGVGKGNLKIPYELLEKLKNSRKQISNV